MFSAQWDQPILQSATEEELAKLGLEAKVILDLPKKLVTDDFFIEHDSLTAQEVREEILKRPDFEKYRDYQFDLVLSIKESRICKAIDRLYIKVYQKYKAEADALGLELNGNNFYEEVMQDITFRDLTPSDISFAFDIFTRRRLIRNGQFQ